MHDEMVAEPAVNALRARKLDVVDVAIRRYPRNRFQRVRRKVRRALGRRHFIWKGAIKSKRRVHRPRDVSALHQYLPEAG